MTPLESTGCVMAIVSLSKLIEHCDSIEAQLLHASQLAKRLTVAGKNRNFYIAVARHFIDGVVQIYEQILTNGIVSFRPVERNQRNRTVYFQQYSFFHEVTPLKLESDIHPNRQNNRCDAFPLQAPLDGERRLVVKNFLKGIFLAEDQLPRKN